MPLIGTRVSLPARPLVHHVFGEHVRRTPDALALTCGPYRLTYRELDRRANQFAHLLHAHDVGPGSIVGVCLDRSPELMVAILGILKAGGAYAALDPAYPTGRLDVMTAQLSQMQLVVASASTIEQVAGRVANYAVLNIAQLGTILDAMPSTDPDVMVTGENLCYIVFTSGSTGTPKATAARHQSWVNMFTWLRDSYELDTTASGLAVSSLGFDISQRGLMAPLFMGATLHLLPSRYFDVKLAYKLIDELDVKTIHCAPSTLYLLVDRERSAGSNALAKMQYIFIGGEPLAAARLSGWAGQPGNTCRLLHQYGVAECTDLATSYLMRYPEDFIRFEEATAAPLSAGHPVHNTTIYILDETLQAVPDAQIGEICISGLSVGGGYLNDPELELARFVSVELDGDKHRVYRTGDRGYIKAGGELVVVGRTDQQVKIRGTRIDLGDVEHNIRSYPHVHDVIVVAHSAGDDGGELVAFVIPANGVLDERELRASLLNLLPPMVIPRRIVEVSAFPLSPNGKVDRAALTARAAS